MGPNERRTPGWISDRVGDLLGDLAIGCHCRPYLALAVVSIVTAAALACTVGRLSLNADLAELLPESFESVTDLEVLKERFGGIGYVAVVAKNAPPEVLERFAEETAAKLEALAAVRYVQHRRPTRFFEERVLYFLDVQDLRLLRDRIRDRIALEKRRHFPMYFELDEPPPIDFAELQERLAGRRETSWVQTQLGETYYLDREQRLVALLCKPAALSADLAFSRKLVGQVKLLIEGLDLEQYHSEMTIAYGGNYTKKVDQHEMIMSDLALASALAVALMSLFLMLHFRRVVAVGLIMGPLVVGLIWTHAFAAVGFGSLNILTGFIGAILLGLGIDHGIHLLSRYESELAATGEPETAVRRSFGDTGRAVVVAALTTTVGFAGLGLSEFRAFREFGIIAAGGMALVVIAYLTSLPALLSIAARSGWRPCARPPETPTGWNSNLKRHAGKVLVLCVLLTIPLVIELPKARFNTDFRALVASDLPSFRMDFLIDRLLGFSQTPVVVMATNQEEERLVAAALRERQAHHGDETTIDFVATGADLVPPNQEAKWEVLQSLAADLEKVNPAWLSEDLRGRFELFRRATNVPPFTDADWPIEVQRQFRGPDTAEGEGFVLVYPGVDLSDGARVSEFADELRGITLPSGKRVAVAGEPMILADIFDMVMREAPPVLGLTLVLVFLATWLLLGSFRHAVLCLVPAGLTLVGTFALLHGTRVELNYINIVMVPVLFGISVDGGVHLVTRAAHAGDLGDAATATGRAIAGAILTTCFGFGALLLADHKGLDSLGELAVLGLAVNLLACLVALPALLAWRPSLLGPRETQEPQAEARGDHDAP